MNKRLLEIIQYATCGKQIEFAEIMGWSPQYLNRLIKGENGIGLRPIIAILKRFPEINARWILLGEGAMITPAIDTVKRHLLKLLEIEKYMPVMSLEELKQVQDGRTDFEPSVIARWEEFLADRSKKINDRFDAAYQRQEELCKQNKAK